MSVCQTESQMDDYLLGRMEEAEREAFERHYFNCPSCFARVEEKSVLLSLIKEGGEVLFKEEARSRPAKAGAAARLAALLSPRQWSAAALSAAVVIAAVILFFPRSGESPAPGFFVGGDTLRGSQVEPLSPVSQIPEKPSAFRWESAGDGVEYRFTLFDKDGEILWSGETGETSLALPGSVSGLLEPGENYSWEIKAFSPQGALTAASGRVQFSIAR